MRRDIVQYTSDLVNLFIHIYIVFFVDKLE